MGLYIWELDKVTEVVAMKKYLNLCNIYILLWCLYYLQGIVYAEGSAISQMILLIIMSISAFYFVYVNRTWKVPPFMRVLNLFIAVMTIYGIALIFDPQPIYAGFILSETLAKHEPLKSIYMSMLPIFVMYYASKRGLLTIRVIQIITFVLLLSVTLTYFRVQNQMLQEAMKLGFQQEEFTNNTGYQFLALFPLLFFFLRRPFVQYLLMAYIFTFIVMGMKRGAIIIGIICLVWFIYRLYSSSSHRNRVYIVVLTVIALIVGVSQIMDFYQTSEYFQYRVTQTMEGDSSARDGIYSTLWNNLKEERSIIRLFFGNGAMASVRIAGTFAHNDWLELAVGQGLFGIGIYALYFLTLLREFLLAKQDALRYNILGMLLLIMFTSSLFSMSYDSLSLSTTICLGYCMAHHNSKRLENSLSN